MNELLKINFDARRFAEIEGITIQESENKHNEKI